MTVDTKKNKYSDDYCVNLQVGQLDVTDIKGYSPLHWAVQSGNTLAVKLLLACGAKPNAMDRAGATPLHFAAVTQGYKQGVIVEALLKAGADVTATDHNGQTALHWLAGVCHDFKDVDIVKMLVQADCSPDSRDNLGNTPLHWAAASSSYVDVIPWLMTAPGTANVYGDTVLHTAAGFGNCNILHCLILYYSNRLVGLFEACVQACTNDAGQTPLQLAVVAGFSMSAVKLLSECMDDGCQTAVSLSACAPFAWRLQAVDFCVSHTKSHKTALWTQPMARVDGTVDQVGAQSKWQLCYRLCALTLTRGTVHWFCCVALSHLSNVCGVIVGLDAAFGLHSWELLHGHDRQHFGSVYFHTGASMDAACNSLQARTPLIANPDTPTGGQQQSSFLGCQVGRVTRCVYLLTSLH